MKSKIIQGTLLEDNDSWVIEYEAEKAGDDASWFNKLPLHPDDFTFLLSHGKQVKFLIVDEPALIECGKGETNYNIRYAKIIDNTHLRQGEGEESIEELNSRS
jgi:hypothetical protein